MKAITLWQPWATLCVQPRPHDEPCMCHRTAAGSAAKLLCEVRGVRPFKTIETRSWKAPDSIIGKRIAIHAAARQPDKAEIGQFEVWPADSKSKPHPNHPDGRPARMYRNDVEGMTLARWRALPLGAIVGSAVLKACVPMVGYRDADNSVGREVNFGDEDGWRYPLDLKARQIDIINGPRLKIDHDPRQRRDVEGTVTTDSVLELQGIDGPGVCQDVSDQAPFGDFAPGRWAWILEGAVRFVEPIPVKGRQRVWNLPDELRYIARGATS